MMMSNKRGSEDISGEFQQGPQNSTPKRSKLDFLAMIAEMSEKKEVSAPVNPPVLTESEEEASIVEPPKLGDSPVPVNKKPSSPKAPKSSFAAWKLAKGRKNGSKSPNKKDIGLASESNIGIKKDTPLEAPVAALPVVSPVFDNPLLTLAAAAAPLPVPVSPTRSLEVEVIGEKRMTTGSLPPKKKATKNKGSKKNGVKKDKKGLSPKKVPAKSTGGASDKINGSKKSKKVDQSAASSTFPEKIMEFLQADLAPKAIFWLPDGESIAVDPGIFQDSPIISKQFRGNKLSSFVRSLNRWGFRRIFYHSLPEKTLAFHHKLFQKQAPGRVKEMKMDAGSDKETELPPGAMSTAASAVAERKAPTVVEDPQPKKPESPVSSLSPKPAIPALVESARTSPVLAASSPALQAMQAARASPRLAALSPAMQAMKAAMEVANRPAPAASSPALQAVQAALQAASMPAPAPPVRSPEAAFSSLTAQVPSRCSLERQAMELVAAAEGRQAFQLQHAMAAEQERSDWALQSLQAQQLVLQSLADQQNVAQAEELLMQSMLAEQQRSEIALQQRQAEEALLQQMVAEQESAALAAALGGAGTGRLGAEALLRERLLVQQFAANPAQAASGSDVLALLRQQLHGGQQPQAREPSYMEQLLFLEQQQQQQRQHEAALLAAHGFRFG